MAINYISERVKFTVKFSLFVDDFANGLYGTLQKTKPYYLHDTKTSLVEWSATSGYRFSLPLYSKNHRASYVLRKYPALDEKINNNTSLQTSKSIKIIGITFDHKNTINT